ncbi:MAG: indole-3-glycerol-phosphate synthase, partial [Clostridium sp.]|nr:indole-3-glycerol-phosphate synthase [Clostridium sp.]
YLQEIRKISPLPIIRKDFIIEEYQVYEAKVIGADAILLIAAILNDAEMKQLYELAYSLGLDVLLEVHNEEEMKRAIELGAKIVGVNNRDLRDFSISLETTKHLIQYLEKETGGKRPVFVSESGVTKTEDIEFLKECKVNALLIGRAFMEAEKPLELAKEWKAVYNQ